MEREFGNNAETLIARVAVYDVEATKDDQMFNKGVNARDTESQQVVNIGANARDALNSNTESQQVVNNDVNARDSVKSETQGQDNVVVDIKDVAITTEDSENVEKTIKHTGKCYVNTGIDYSEFDTKETAKFGQNGIKDKADRLDSSDADCLRVQGGKECFYSSHLLVWLLFRVCVCLACGVVFGFCVQKGRVFEPKSIRDQMVFESFIMLKMFLGAVCTGQLIFSVLSILPQTKTVFRETIIEYIACFGSKGIITSAIGAAVLGAGMTLSGACPGMVLAQVGSWVPNSIFTLVGCMIGALSYGMLAPLVERFTKPTKVFKNQTVHQTLKWPYIAIALPMSVMLFVVVFLLEYFWDYTKDLENIDRRLPPYDNIVTAVAWRPSIAGGIIGVLQLPLVFTVHDTMGGSTSYVTMVSQWVITKKLQETFPYLAKKRCGISNWWQVVYVWGAILGAALASIASDTMATSKGVTLPAAIFGGIMMLWGARFAAGCTSGHGLSGMGLLAWLSFIAVPFMFVGGIITAFSMQATGALDDYVTDTLGT